MQSPPLSFDKRSCNFAVDTNSFTGNGLGDTLASHDTYAWETDDFFSPEVLRHLEASGGFEAATQTCQTMPAPHDADNSDRDGLPLSEAL